MDPSQTPYDTWSSPYFGTADVLLPRSTMPSLALLAMPLRARRDAVYPVSFKGRDQLRKSEDIASLRRPVLRFCVFISSLSIAKWYHINRRRDKSVFYLFS
jgi:hypothetical protein